MGARRLGDVMKLFLILFCLSHVCLFPALLAQKIVQIVRALDQVMNRGGNVARDGVPSSFSRLPVVQALDSDGTSLLPARR